MKANTRKLHELGQRLWLDNTVASLKIIASSKFHKE